jgi:alpha-glucoside transport system permease protein
MATVARERVTETAPPEKGGRGFDWKSLLWIAPAVILILAFFIYPLIQTLIYSFQNADETAFVGFKNYIFIGTDQAMIEAIRNNLLWLVLATILTVGLGLIIALLVDRVKIEAVIKSALFIPMALSYVAASVIWKFVFDYSPQIGLLNAFLGLFHVPQQAWLQNPAFNNFALIAIYTWMWTGFSVVIISAALKGIPDDVIEAAKMDGAGRFSLFFRVMVPMIGPTLGVVATTMIINILKIFDVIYVETGGNYGTNVIAMEYYNQAFNFNNYGTGSALAILLTVIIIPVMIINVRRIRREELGR